LLFAVAALALLAGCGKTDPQPKTPTEALSEDFGVTDLLLTKRIPMTPAMEAEFAKDPQWRELVKDRKELISPPPPDFRPEAVGRKIKLGVVVEKKILRRGDRLRFRLLVQNIGTKTVDWNEDFFKLEKVNGAGSVLEWKYILTEPGGVEVKLERAFRPSPDPLEYGDQIIFPEHWTDDQIEAEKRRISAASEASGSLRARLYSGETIRTAPPNGFRDFGLEYDFKTLGTYRLRVVYNDAPLQPYTEEDLDEIVGDDEAGRKRRVASRLEFNQSRLGVVKSNVVSFEVVP